MAELGQEFDQGADDFGNETTDAPIDNAGEQSVNSDQTTSGPDSTDTFFDPESIIGTDLEPAYKQMQSAYTKKMQNIAESRKKIEAFDAFQQNPVETIRQLARQYGIDIAGTQQQQTEFNPQDWNDVFDRMKQEVLKELNPVFNEVQNMKRSNMEMYLDNHYPDWREHEDEMVTLVKAHPTLAKDPDKLYRLAMPEEVIQQRAMQRAMQKVKGQSDAGQMSGASTTTRSINQNPPEGLTLNEAVDFAKAKLAKQGIRPPRE